MTSKMTSSSPLPAGPSYQADYAAIVQHTFLSMIDTSPADARLIGQAMYSKQWSPVCEHFRRRLASLPAATTNRALFLEAFALIAITRAIHNANDATAYDDSEMVHDLDSVAGELRDLPGGLRRCFYLGTLGIALYRHFNQTQDLSTLTRSEDILQVAIRSSTELREVVEERPEEMVRHRFWNSRTFYVGALGDVKESLYKITGEYHYLDEAIHLFEERWADETDRGPVAVTAGLMLLKCIRTKVWLYRYPKIDLARKGISITDEILDLTLSHNDRSHHLRALMFQCDFHLWIGGSEIDVSEKDVSMLDGAIEVAESIRSEVRHLADGSTHMGTLMDLYLARSKYTYHESTNLEKAVQVAKDRLDVADAMAVGPGITKADILVEKAGARSDLGRCYQYRYENTQDSAFLREALRLAMEATSLSEELGSQDPNHIFHGLNLAKVRCSLTLRTFLNRDANAAGLTESISWIRDILRDPKLSQSHEIEGQLRLCHCLSHRFTTNSSYFEGDVQDLIEMVPKIQNTADKNDLAQTLMLVYRHNHDPQILELAVSCAKVNFFSDARDNAQELSSASPAARKFQSWLKGFGPVVLAEALLSRSALFHGEEWSDDAAEALEILKQCIRVKSSTTDVSMKAIMLLSDQIILKGGKIDSSFLASATKEAVRLLPRAVSRALTREDIKTSLRLYVGVGATAAAAALAADHSAEEAIELLEGSRGILATYLLDFRVDAHSSNDSDQNEAERALKSKLKDKLKALESARTGGRNVPPKLSGVGAAYELDLEIEKTLDQLQPLTESRSHLIRPPNAAEMKTAICDGAIVVINASFRCDAIIIYKQKIWSLPLPRLEEKTAKLALRCLDMMRKRSNLQSPRELPAALGTVVLIWLWVVAVKPILDSLGFTSTPSQDLPGPSTSNWPRVWWVPTGILSQLPFHAAGIHEPGGSSSTLDRVVSSYSSSIKSLLFTLQNVRDEKTPETKLDPMVVIPMANTNGLRPLPFADNEASSIETVLGDSVEIRQLKRPRKEDVLRELGSCNIFHFAGHGASFIEDPDRGHLCLDDWKSNPLTVEDLLNLELHRRTPWLAYLSACSTGMNQISWLRDEAIHLVAACQLAGFQHVIGSFWEVSDSWSQEAARLFYTSLKSTIGKGNDVAFALHTAVRELRRNAQRIENPTAALGQLHQLSTVSEDERTTEGGEENVENVMGDDEADVNQLLQGLSDASACRTAEDWEKFRDADRVEKERKPRGNISIDPMIWASYFHVGL